MKGRAGRDKTGMMAQDEMALIEQYGEKYGKQYGHKMKSVSKISKSPRIKSPTTKKYDLNQRTSAKFIRDICRWACKVLL
jgi:hypothetical protein